MSSDLVLPPFPWICLVTDHTLCRAGLVGLQRAVGAALDNGVNVVQLREKSLSSRELYDFGCRLRALTTEAGAALVVNDRVDVAMAIHADGVHLGETGLPVPAARKLVGKRLVGRSVHGLPEAIEAEQIGADYLVLGTIFPTPSHHGIAAAGPALIGKVNDRVSLPVLAIGGITAENAAQAVASGASGVAVIRSILADPHPGQAARRLSEQVHAAWPSAVLHREA